MEALIDALTGMMKRGQRRSDARKSELDVGAAPASIQAMAEAMSRFDYKIDLQAFRIRGSSPVLRTLEPEISMAEEFDVELDAALSSAGPGGEALNLKQTLLLEQDTGGMSALGVYWEKGSAYLMIVEMDDPTEGNLVQLFDSPASFFSQLDDINKGKSTADTNALREATGELAATESTAAAPVGVLKVWEGAKRAAPNALAVAHFGNDALVQQSDATPAGRVLLVSRTRSSKPGTIVIVRSADGSDQPVEWPELTDVFGICLVPGTERVIVCTGNPGPVVEVDLETLRTRELFPSAKWSCGFVGEEALVLLVDGEAQVFSYDEGALGKPLAATPVGMSISVFHGHVLSRTKDYSTVTFQTLRWDGSRLLDAGELSVSEKVSTFSGATVVDGHKLIAGVGYKAMVWYELI